MFVVYGSKPFQNSFMHGCKKLFPLSKDKQNTHGFETHTADFYYSNLLNSLSQDISKS